MRKYCHNLLKEVDNFNVPLFKLATQLEEIALNDDYFVKKKLYPNVDFYSGIILKALGLPESMFTVIFAVARTVGWIAQWKEMIETESKELVDQDNYILDKKKENLLILKTEKNNQKCFLGNLLI